MVGLAHEAGCTSRWAPFSHSSSCRIRARVGEMTLGTAQLGLKYGVANRTGKPNRETATSMVRDAIGHGVTTLDTARAYGDAEEVLGQSLTGAWRSRAEVITKLDPLAGLSALADRATLRPP